MDRITATQIIALINNKIADLEKYKTEILGLVAEDHGKPTGLFMEIEKAEKNLDKLITDPVRQV